MSQYISSKLRSVFFAAEVLPEENTTPCYHHGCFGQSSCSRSLLSGASLLDPKHDDTSILHTLETHCENSACGESTPCIPYIARSSKLKSTPTINELSELPACGHPACIDMVSCLKSQGREEIRRILKSREVMPQQLMNQMLDIDEDDFHWD
jgi:hypothetical protein